MTNHHEHLRPIELFQGKESAETPADLGLMLAQVEHVVQKRNEMLSSIASDIGPAFLEALRAKIEYEKTFLLKVIETNARMAATKKRLNKILKSEYFTLKSLDAHLL